MSKLQSLLKGLVDASLSEVLPDLTITGVASDSREVEPGYLFIALKGFGGPHGLAFVGQARDAGALAVVWEPAENVDQALLAALASSGLYAVEVEDLQRKTAAIAARFYHQPSRNISVVGITGTDGKTSCAWMLAQAWKALGQSAAMLGTLGKGQLGNLRRGGFTTPFPVELQRELAGFVAAGVEHLAMEVSSHALHQARTAEIAFDYAVLTNLGRDHLDYHGSIEAYAAAKKQLFISGQAKVAVLNVDDPAGAAWVDELLAAGKAVVSYGRQPADVCAQSVQCVPVVAFDLCYQNQSVAVRSQLLGEFNVYNLLAVAAVLLDQGLELQAVADVLSLIKAPPGRLELFSHNHKSVVVDYAHTANALEASLSSLRGLYDGRVHCVFGCGGDRDTGKRPLMAKAAENSADQVWVTDDNPRSEPPENIFSDIRAGFERAENVRFMHDRAATIKQAIGELNSSDILLVAGKGHEDYQITAAGRQSFSDRALVAQQLGLPAPEVLYAA